MTIEPAQPHDAEAIAAVEAAAAAAPWTVEAVAGHLSSPTALVLVARDGDRIVGHVLATRVVDEGELLSVAVHPAARRRGLGRALVEACQAAWRDAAVAAAWLEVRTDNAGAIALYETTGWTREGRRRAYYADGCDAIVMAWRPTR